MSSAVNFNCSIGIWVELEPVRSIGLEGVKGLEGLLVRSIGLDGVEGVEGLEGLLAIGVRVTEVSSGLW